MYDALYGRQSIEKKDSISVESQLEYCRYETHGNPCQEYADRGFSGKDTRRPDFERMIEDIKARKINRVIVYKLDRISRSILDFANMMELFQKYDVEFISSTEKFDTSTPIGRAMLNICIVFAQLERETIQKRVADAYYARSKRGFYMGGRIPYGFRLVKTTIDQVRTSMYEELPQEREQLKLIYSLYADFDNSLGDIVLYLKEHSIKNLRSGVWNTARLSELLKNPIYVETNMDVYHFFISQGAQVYNSPDDFINGNACYLYRRDSVDAAAQTRSDLKDKEVILAPHKGFIPPKLWLACQRRCLSNRRSTKTCKPKSSWLTGKIKCKSCGYALAIKRADTKWNRYFICSAAGHGKTCENTTGTIYATVLEQFMMQAIKKKLGEFDRLIGEESCLQNPSIDRRKLRLAQIETELSELLFKSANAGTALMKYINEKAEELYEERRSLQETPLFPINALAIHKEEITDHTAKWDILSFEDRQAVVNILIHIIYIADGTMEIIWNI